MNLYLISICALFHVSQTQYVDIWSSDKSMYANNGWIGYNNFNFTWSSDECIIGPCCYITADNDGPSYTEKVTNITSYSSIQFQVDITAYSRKQAAYCQIWYNFDNYTAYTKHSTYNYGKYRNVKVNFPESIKPNTIYIRLQVIGNHSACFWDNAILKGMRIPKNMRGIFMPVNISNSTTDITYRNSSTSTWIIIAEICAIVPCVCCILIVIVRLTLKKIHKKKHGIKSSLSNVENLQSAIMEIMSSLQLSEYYTPSDHSINTKISHAQIQPSDNHATDMHSTTYTTTSKTYTGQLQRIVTSEKDTHSSTYTTTTSDQLQCSVPSKKVNYVAMNQSEFDDDDEEKCLTNHSNVTTIPASETSSYESTKKKSSYESLVKQVNLNVFSKADTLSLVGKLDGMLNELEFEILKLKDQWSVTDVNTYYSTTNVIVNVDSTTVPESVNTNSIGDVDAITEVDPNLSNASMFVNMDNKYKETFL